MKRIFILILCLSTFYAYSQYASEDVNAYIAKYSALAEKAMKEYKIPASVKLAQAIYSSEAGQNQVSREANNHFGLLCNTEYTGELYYETSDRSGNCYRMYASTAESFEDHNLFLTKRERYASLFNLAITDYRGWANGLQYCGYSANPEYANKLINIIEKYDLTRFDIKQDVSKPAEPKQIAVSTSEQTQTSIPAEKPEPIATPTPTPETTPAATPSPKPAPQVATNTNKEEANDGIQPDTIINGIEIYIQPRKKVNNNADAANGSIISMHVFTAQPNEYRVSYFPYTKRDVYENNKIKFIIAEKGDTYARIAYETQLNESDLRIYNDAPDEYQPIPGEVVYLQMKSNKSETSYHKLSAGDSFRYVSQKYAVQIKTLMKRNPQPAGGFSEGSLICIDCK
ncbi:MAG: glucosaminidase domain-containing protein [Bacteroidales bacterium]|nr:glucosaminidase domain-containing protein [Bacteroidales bacterium]